jgi:hypothetical protein
MDEMVACFLCRQEAEASLKKYSTNKQKKSTKRQTFACSWTAICQGSNPNVNLGVTQCGPTRSICVMSKLALELPGSRSLVSHPARDA